jgi:diguanylate cyclase (GGDEF)-like protein/PAS domain S-box-containing protein
MRKVEPLQRIAAMAFETQQGMAITDAKYVIVRVNKAFTEITGYTAEEAVGQTPHLLSSGRHDAAFYDAMWKSINLTGCWQGEIWNKRKNGKVFPEWLAITAVCDDAGPPTHYLAAFSDNTFQNTAEAQIQSLAFSDPLTGLPNRQHLVIRLQQTLLGSSLKPGRIALLAVDLDQFKTLNDAIGHEKGNRLLQTVARRLLSSVRKGDTVARLAGSQFVVMLEVLNLNLQELANEVETLARKIVLALTQPYAIDSSKHHSTASIGIVLLDENSLKDVDESLNRASLALYRAKADGRNTIRFFNPDMLSAATARVALEASLREGLLKDQFALYYQAQVKGTKEMLGVEALLRWHDPQNGLVAPAGFIPVAEETGLILPLGQWVLEAACQQLARWSEKPGMVDLTIAINVSALQFHQDDFVEQVLAVLERTGANPNRLKLELTESLLVTDIEEVIARMNALKAIGIRFSLDDFGVGYSSLSYLKRLPLDQLKIDRSFVRDILLDSHDAAIARMVIALADSLGLDVIAEGVETEAQRVALANMGCNSYQGYLFGRPLPLQEFEIAS